MNKSYMVLGWICLLVMTGCKQNPSSTEFEQWKTQADNVTIYRDNYGVPHVYGKTDADAVFGMLYAQCEDDFPRVERNYIWAIGRLAEVKGEEMLYSDLRARMFMTKEEAIKLYEESPEWLRELCDAFADGINYYLHTHPTVKPKLLTRFEPWMPMYFSEGSIGGDIERVSVRKIRAHYEKENLSLQDLNQEEDLFREPVGSNGFAIGGQWTQSGNAMLLINPHTSFYFRGEMHVVSEAGLNAYGAVTWGQFFIYQGFNEKTGWMHTSTYTDVIDEFVEAINKESLTYQYGDEQRTMDTFHVSLKYLSGDQQATKVFPVYRTHHGPVTHSIDGDWVSTAMMWDPVNALTQSYTRTKQPGLKEFNDMMKIKTNSSNNTVYADADGNIAYYHGNFIPERDEDFDYTQPVDGANPETDWQGLHSVDEAIVVTNPPNGWIQNCNSTPFTSAGEHSPKVEDYPKYMSINRENFRGVHAISLLSNLKSKQLDLDGLIELAYDPHLPAFEQIIPGIVEAYDQADAPDPSMKAPIEELRNWDYRVSKESAAMTLAHFYAMKCLREGDAPKDLSGMARLHYFGKGCSLEDRLSLFSKTIKELENSFGTSTLAWGEVNRFQRLTGDIDLAYDDEKPSIPIGLASGRWGALASYGSRAREGTHRLYGSSGNSFVAVVEFGDRVQAKSLLAGGQSGDVNSPHFLDQAERYANAQFKTVHYYLEDVKTHAKSQYRIGSLSQN